MVHAWYGTIQVGVYGTACTMLAWYFWVHCSTGHLVWHTSSSDGWCVWGQLRQITTLSHCTAASYVSLLPALSVAQPVIPCVHGVVWCGGHVVVTTVWCGVVWCGVVWCGVVWCGVVWCGVVWCGVVWCGVVWCGVVWCGVVWCGVVWCGVVWCGVVWCGGV
jgi:hypothetical protein